ncbi:hypothetical protein [Levilactobacillus fujinensis]|uniref:Uncharacterized protein n=1 Tax=Levilactobacillus fujinensis TaxID=2486024 RepID=A0ABW1TF96_9LACO|nr:hypothetical protein [Levilactobacillus fujinensis]
MANTKNSQAAKIRQQIITWLQDDQETEVVSATKFPGIRGIRAVKLRQMLGALGFASSVVMGAVSAAPSIDRRIKKAALKPREVYYYFDANTETPVNTPATAPIATTPVPTATVAVTKPVSVNAPAATGLTATDAFTRILASNRQLSVDLNALLTDAQQQRPLTDLDLDFLTSFSAQVAKQAELLQTFTTQSRIDQLRH